VLVAEDTSKGGCALVRQRHLIETRVLIAFVRAFLIGFGVLLVFGCSAGRSEAPKEQQGQTEATVEEQARSPEATASEEARCEGTRTIDRGIPFTTNDVPGCPSGGVLRGTEKADKRHW
jgi:hypothetical protein